ncbi:MAG: hypothetical protein V4596_11250 [Bdellovibrionota bacterium]
MKRSINTENLIVVTAIAIAVSLLASACGPSSTKTLKAKTGVKVFSDKAADRDTNTSEDKSQEEQILKAIQEKRIADGETIVDVNAAKDLASRIKYVKYEFLEGSDQIDTALTINNKLYKVNFKEGKVSEDGLTIEFSKPSESSEELANLNLSAKIQKQNQSLVIVSLYEKTTDAKKVVKTAEVSVLVKLNKAVANVTSKDANILIMKGATIDTRTSQVYISDNSVLEAKLIDQIQRLESKANTIVINVYDAKTSAFQYSLLSVLSLKSNTTNVLLNSTSVDLESMKDSYKKMELISGSAVLDAKEFTLTFEDKKSNEASSALLTLSSVEDNSKSDEQLRNEDPAEAPSASDENNQPQAPAASEVTGKETGTQTDTKVENSEDALEGFTDLPIEEAKIMTAPTTPKTDPKATTVLPKTTSIAPKGAMGTGKKILENNLTIGKAIVNAVASPATSAYSTVQGIAAAKENIAIAGDLVSTVTSKAASARKAVTSIPVSITKANYGYASPKSNSLRTQEQRTPVPLKPSALKTESTNIQSLQSLKTLSQSQRIPK